MPWTIEYTDTALNDLRKLDKRSIQRIVDYIDKRVAGTGDPRNTGRALIGPMGKLWRYRVGDYRVICDIQTGALRVLVIRVGRRDKVYR